MTTLSGAFGAAAGCSMIYEVRLTANSNNPDNPTDEQEGQASVGA
jgi:hypothetical protein